MNDEIRMKSVFDALIVAMIALFVASVFTDAIYRQIVHVIPMCAAYGILELVMASARHRHEEEFGLDPTEPVRHRFCMVLYMHGITVADWGVGSVLVAYAILARFAKDRGAVFGVHSLGMIAMAVATVIAQPKGLVAWTPAITLVAIVTFVARSDRSSVEVQR